MTKVYKDLILGISAYYHDSAAALISSGNILAACQEERFSRKKHDPAFPASAVKYCLDYAGVSIRELSAIVFYDKPFLTFDRLLDSYLCAAPKGRSSFTRRMPLWIKEKLMLKTSLKKELSLLGGVSKYKLPRLLFTEHHQSHAASAFFPSPFKKAAVLCLDGVGEWATTSAWLGENNQLKRLWQINFPHSLGLLYSAFTLYCGFKVNSGEYKLMGLAPYGTPVYQQLIEQHLIQINSDGSFFLNMEFFDFAVGDSMFTGKFKMLFGGEPRQPETAITQREKDLASSIQAVIEKVILLLAAKLKQDTGLNYLCLAGGVALNCVANGKLAGSGYFNEIWVQPAAGDAGGALGAAYSGWHTYFDQPRYASNTDKMAGGFLGDRFSGKETRLTLEGVNAVFVELEEQELIKETALLLSNGKVVGWFQEEMEFGPRALGHRSILADPRQADMQSHLNLKIKFRESFRPFAPAILAEKADEYFTFDASGEDDGKKIDSPYMLFVCYIKKRFRYGKVQFPSVVHTDFSSRVQTVSKETNVQFHALISEFDRITGCPMLINTSFNVRGEPVVHTPLDAWNCFMNTNMDVLVIGRFLLRKNDQFSQNNSIIAAQAKRLD